jgi:hypothetical protein
MAALMLVLLVGFVTFDSLVKIQHAEHVDAWLADGSPWGFFWRPPGSAFAGTFSRGWVSMKWILVTPEWVRDDQRAKKLLRRMRVCIGVWNVGVLVTAVIHFGYPSR